MGGMCRGSPTPSAALINDLGDDAVLKGFCRKPTQCAYTGIAGDGRRRGRGRCLASNWSRKGTWNAMGSYRSCQPVRVAPALLRNHVTLPTASSHRTGTHLPGPAALRTALICRHTRAHAGQRGMGRSPRGVAGSLPAVSAAAAALRLGGSFQWAAPALRRAAGRP